jgi:hypothetical protein
MKTIKKRLHKSKSKHSKKNLRKMTGGSLDSIIMSNTLNLMNNIVNYLQIEASRTVYYTQIKFELNSTIINNLITYGLSPNLGGNIVDTSQPYIIYFFVYYYISKVFSEFFKTKDKSGTSNIDLFLLPEDGSPNNQIERKEASRDLELNVGRTYCIFMDLALISSIITIGPKSSQICIRFKLLSTGIQSKNKSNYLPNLVITGIYMLNNEPDNTNIQDYRRIFISKLGRANSDLTSYFTPVPYSDEVRNKLKSITLYTIDIEKQIISSQSTNTMLRFIYLNGETHLKFNPITTENIVIPVQMSATLLTFINKITDTLKGNLSKNVSSSQTNKLSAITENYIPNVLNIYLTTPSYSQIQLNSVLLKQDMFPPYSSSSTELQINPRYDFTKTKSAFTKQFCKSSKECYVDTLYSFSEFTKFNKQNKSGKRLQTIQQVTPNVSGNIETTLSLLLPNYTLKINGEEMVITDYNWDHQWKLTGPKENLLSLQPEYLQNKPPETTVSIETCYKNLLEFYDDLIELFYPSMSGKEITKIYGNYLRVLNERNALVNDIKKLVNKNTFTIKTVGLTADEKTKIESINTKSITLNEYINKFVDSILYQLIVIGNLTRKIINRIHSTCFFIFAFDVELYPSITQQQPIGAQTPSELLSIIPHIMDLLKSEDLKYKGIKYIEDYLSPMYYPDPSKYNNFFSSLQCGSLVVEEYTSIIQSFSNIIKTIFEKLDKIAAHMIEIKDNTSYETLDLSNETLSKLWISDESIEKVFSEFEKDVRAFIKYNLTDTYYSTPVIEKWIDDILWDMSKSNTYTYCRLFTTFVYNNVWIQFEILFSLKVLQYIFLIYQYTGKYIYYKQVPLQGVDIDNNFLSFLGNSSKDVNLFSCIINWFKFNCIFQIQELIKTKGNVTLMDIQTLFATNELIIGSYTLMRYYITRIILLNLDVCQLTTELESFIDILSSNDTDLKNIMPQTIKEKEQNTTSSDKKSSESKNNKNKLNEPDTKKLAYNVQVQVKVKKLSESNENKETKEKLNSNNIYEYLGCKNRDLQFQLNKLKLSAGILSGDITGYISKKTTLMRGPNISQLDENLKLSEKDYPNETSEIKSLFFNEDSIQIISSVNLSENRQVLNQDNFFVSVNKLVYAINKQTSTMKTDKNSMFSTIKTQDTTIADIIDTRIFGLYDTLYKLQY